MYMKLTSITLLQTYTVNKHLHFQFQKSFSAIRQNVLYIFLLIPILSLEDRHVASNIHSIEMEIKAQHNLIIFPSLWLLDDKVKSNIQNSNN